MWQAEKMKITIDENSGFCFGVVYAIQMAEDELDEGKKLYCLGDIVHNDVEVKRLEAKGLQTITHDDLQNLHDCKVLIRAHGEPPETYRICLENNIELIDASCPVVLKLQNRVKAEFDQLEKRDGQIVIFGIPGHAEVKGLEGQTGQKAIVITTDDDLAKIDYSKPISFFSQTTKSTARFYGFKKLIEERAQSAGDSDFRANDTICRQVSNRQPQLQRFAAKHDVIIFVSGRKSSNGKVLHKVCEEVNPKSFFVSEENELKTEWFEDAKSVGICGATSTPGWLMERVAQNLNTTFNLSEVTA